MTDRLSCVVPFCRRTIARRRLNVSLQDLEYTEWLCGKHWVLTDRKLRLAKFRRERLFRRYGDMRHLQRAWSIWKLLRRQAIERAAGISA